MIDLTAVKGLYLLATSEFRIPVSIQTWNDMIFSTRNLQKWLYYYRYETDDKLPFNSTFLLWFLLQKDVDFVSQSMAIAIKLSNYLIISFIAFGRVTIEIINDLILLNYRFELMISSKKISMQLAALGT